MNAPTTQKSAIEASVTIAENTEYTAPIMIGALTLSFINGKRLTLDMGALAPEIVTQAAMHGLKQKLVDAAAISRDPANGKAATIDTKFDAIQEVLNRLLAGEWNKRREGGGQTGGLLKRALLEMYADRKTPEQITEYLDGKSDKEKAALRKNPKVAEIIERLRAADAKDAGEDSGVDLLAELDAE
jgi:hypothetical protein